MDKEISEQIENMDEQERGELFAETLLSIFLAINNMLVESIGDEEDDYYSMSKDLVDEVVFISSTMAESLSNDLGMEIEKEEMNG